MEEHKPVIFCNGGGCTAKLGAGVLRRVLSRLPKGPVDPDLLVGYDSSDDAAVYKVTDDIAIVQTLDFFPPMVEDPYTFGQIAAANALSDIYAMGGVVKTALNIVCFPESMDLNILGAIMQGGAEKVIEAGATLAGGHSIADSGIKYGLSVTGIINPKKVYQNNGGIAGDKLILTKRLGVGLVTTASRVGQASENALQTAIASMTTLNKYAAEIAANYTVHACTDVTGFGLLVHLHEMLGGRLSARVLTADLPVIPEALNYADDFLYTAGGQRNRNFMGSNVKFVNTPFAMQEVLFDPQTSGGLILAVASEEAKALEQELIAAGLPARIFGELVPKEAAEVTVIS